MKEEKIQLILDVQGWTRIKFEEGWLTGRMTKYGISIEYKHSDGRFSGGCFSRKDAKQLYKFLQKCFKKWKEDPEEQELDEVLGL